MKFLTVGYLSYVTNNNYQYRYQDFEKSLKSLDIIDSKNVDLISVDNGSTNEVRSKIKDSKKFSKLFHYDQNFFDINLYYTTAWYAKQMNSKYVCCLFDDFIVFDDAIEDSLKYLEKNQDVACVRIPVYDFNNKDSFDSEITPKSKNPDSVRHYNCVTSKKLQWSGPFEEGKHTFYKCNWHYTSRPTIWKSEIFEKVIEQESDAQSNIMQSFEGYAMKNFNNLEYLVGVLDKGMVKTTSVKNSSRTNEFSSSKENETKVSLKNLREQFLKFTF